MAMKIFGGFKIAIALMIDGSHDDWLES